MGRGKLKLRQNIQIFALIAKILLKQTKEFTKNFVFSPDIFFIKTWIFGCGANFCFQLYCSVLFLSWMQLI